ncbi:unnamed protein product, partial [Phaeothamnion confervicola]
MSMAALKVEDALLYLDEVKRVFEGRPDVYESFLNVMKNFKNGDLDTFGVIKRVSDLFEGYPRLILDFNAFLPDDHQITVADLTPEERRRFLEDKQNMLKLAEGAVPPPPPGMPAPGSGPGLPPLGGPGGMPPGGGGPPGGAGCAGGVVAGGGGTVGTTPPAEGVKPSAEPGPMGPLARFPTPRAYGSGGAGGGGTGRTNSSDDGGPVQPREFDNAISYVTTIKKRFHSEPQIYKAFLEILHTYQKEQRGEGVVSPPHDVLEQVSALFADHPDLLVEFTYFLPDA